MSSRSVEFKSDRSKPGGIDRQGVRRAERKRIAREIHDTFLQGLQALLIRLETLACNPALPESMQEEIAAATTRAREVVREGRDAIRGLRGLDFEPTCLVRAISDASRTRGLGTSPTTSVFVEGQPRLMSPDACKHLTAIVIEALQNIATHAQATSAIMTLDYRETSFGFTVKDNGCGFDPTVLDLSCSPDRYGLAGMFERADLLNADLSIHTRIGGGTTVRLISPSDVYA